MHHLNLPFPALLAVATTTRPLHSEVFRSTVGRGKLQKLCNQPYKSFKRRGVNSCPPPKLLSSSKTCLPSLPLTPHFKQLLHSVSCCIAKSDCVPSRVEKAPWVLESLSVEICQKHSAGLLGPEEYNTPGLSGLTPLTRTLCTEINSADQKPDAPVDTQNHNPHCLQCTQYCLLDSVFLFQE